MEEDGRKSGWLAKKSHCAASVIYRIYQQPPNQQKKHE